MKAIFLAIGVLMGAAILVAPNIQTDSQNRAQTAYERSQMPRTQVVLDPNSKMAKDMALAASFKEQAMEDWKSGDLKLARAKLQSALSIFPYSPETPLLLARLCEQMGDHEASLTYYRKTFLHGSESGSTIDTDPTALSEYAREAEKFSSSEAEAAYKRVSEVGRDSIGGAYPALPKGINVIALAHAKTGLELFMRDQFAKAAAEFDKASQYEPSDPVIAYYRGYMHMQAGDKAGARTYLAQAKQARSASISQHALDVLDARAH